MSVFFSCLMFDNSVLAPETCFFGLRSIERNGNREKRYIEVKHELASGFCCCFM